MTLRAIDTVETVEARVDPAVAVAAADQMEATTTTQNTSSSPT